ncbi:mitochondrial ribosomal protein L37 [Andrena cerasifolii]|uniref:mitochondrial ribosomal protein L37 n=1 Tax=Andrena cerasifolii TaxID=2819439 RepID=UPI0040383A50
MKFTQLLRKQHIGRAVRSLWQTQRDRSITVTNAKEVLTSMGFTVQDALEVVKPPKQFSKLEIPGMCDAMHPDWKEKSCLTYKDHDVLQGGISQACLLTNTLKVDDELPEKIRNMATDIPEHVDDLLKRMICTSNIYDAQQVKLPKLKDPNRPSWVFPRVYGVTSTRKMRNLSRKFLQLCESLSGLSVAQNRSVVHDGVLSMCIDKESDLLQFFLKMEFMVTSLKPLTAIADANAYNNLDMPILYPLHHTIGLSQTNTYKTEDMYPINVRSALMNAHTILVNYDPEEVKNLTELPVTESQIHARSLIKSFTAAMACARQRFGRNVKELPEPVVVQCIQSDGQSFHFSVYQLNSLTIDNAEGNRNFWWSSPSMKLYRKAEYENGRPYLEGYNNEVFKVFHAFYKNT